MSLLLDALKRAAEQKAAKSKQEESAADAPDTALDVSSGREALPGDIEDDSLPRHRLEDETELDQSRLEARFKRVRGAGDDATETGIEVSEYTDSALLPLRDQRRSGEDETLIFSEEDFAETVGGDDSIPPPAADDETDLSLLASIRGDSNRDAAQAVEPGRSDLDETDLSQLAAGSEEDGPGDRLSAGSGQADREETDLRLPARDDAREDGKPPPRAGEETDLSLPSAPAQDPQDESAGVHGPIAEETDLSAAAQVDDDAGIGDDDMSLMLVEREPTQITSPGSVTDPQSPHEALRSLQAEAPTADDLGLVETTLHRAAADPVPAGDTTQTRSWTGNSATTRNRSADTATTGIATATANLGKIPRPDPNSTQNYAPDNYDRTLMRLPNDEASRLFSGMKNDSDVVMTPDYAKQVFRSKSSAIRLQHLKVYSGIAVAILLGIGVFGILEYQSESENIDANLRPLKNDPLPGNLRSESGSPEAEPLFAEAQVDQRALEILQKAGNLGDLPAADEAPLADTASAEAAPVQAETAANPQPLAISKPASGNEPAAGGARSDAVETTAARADAPAAHSGAGKVKGPELSPPIALSEPPRQSAAARIQVATTTPANADAGNGSTRLRIETGERLEAKQLLLREAYDAYQSGNDARALQLYNQVLATDPGNRNALLARAAIHVHNGDSAAAIGDYQTLLLANPKDSLAMASLLAVARVSPLESETRLKLMIRDEPESPHLNFALANAYAAQARWQEAQGHYFTALQNNPEDPNYAYNLAVSLEHISQPHAAVSYYRRALENYNKGLATFSREAVDRRLEKLAKS